MIIRSGLEFYPIGGDPRALSALLVKTGGWLVPNAFRSVGDEPLRALKHPTENDVDAMVWERKLREKLLKK
jgi:hypothetical protein